MRIWAETSFFKVFLLCCSQFEGPEVWESVQGFLNNWQDFNILGEESCFQSFFWTT